VDGDNERTNTLGLWNVSARREEKLLVNELDESAGDKNATWLYKDIIDESVVCRLLAEDRASIACNATVGTRMAAFCYCSMYYPSLPSLSPPSASM
jgi:hypothetical protein